MVRYWFHGAFDLSEGNVKIGQFYRLKDLETHGFDPMHFCHQVSAHIDLNCPFR